MFNYNWGFDWLEGGLIKLLVIIATLQIVKKIPDLINSIFGTQIKDQGGIKGRLGEMAGIGGLAQRAWTSLGTGVKNLAKLGLQAPLVGGYLAADAIYHHKKGDRLKNSKVFRTGKGIIYGAKAGLKSGSLLDAYQGYEQSSALSALTKADAQGIANNIETRANNEAGFRGRTYDNRTIKEVKDNAGNVIGTELGYKNYTDIANDRAALTRISAESLTSKQGQKYHSTLQERSKHNQYLNVLDGYLKAKDKLVGVKEGNEGLLIKFNDRIQKSNLDQEIKTKISGIVNKAQTESIKIEGADANFMKMYMDQSEAKSFAEITEKLDKNVQFIDSGYNRDYGTISKNKFVDKESIWKSATFADIYNDAKAQIEADDAKLQRITDEKTTSDRDKVIFNEIKDRYDQIDGKTWGTVQNDPKGDRTGDLSWADKNFWTTGTYTDFVASQKQAQQQVEQQNQLQQSAIVTEISTLEAENKTLAKELENSFVDGSTAAAKRRDDIRKRRHEINARIRELQEQQNKK